MSRIYICLTSSMGWSFGMVAPPMKQARRKKAIPARWGLLSNGRHRQSVKFKCPAGARWQKMSTQPFFACLNRGGRMQNTFHNCFSCHRSMSTPMVRIVANMLTIPYKGIPSNHSMRGRHCARKMVITMRMIQVAKKVPNKSCHCVNTCPTSRAGK